jgi:Flp pilus assembly protein TadG
VTLHHRVEDKDTSILRKRILAGQAVIEFALVLPFLLLIVIGALEFGRVYYAKIVLTNAAREGAYFLSINKGDSTNCSGSGPSKICFLDTRQAIMSEANNSGVTLSNNDITINTPCCTSGSPAIVNVATTVDNVFLIHILSDGFSTDSENTSLTLSVTVQMVVQ